MTYREQIFKILSVSTPTNSELARMVVGRDTRSARGTIRKEISNLRYEKNVSIFANEFGRYSMLSIYTQDDERWQNRLVLSKAGRPRKVA